MSNPNGVSKVANSGNAFDMSAGALQGAGNQFASINSSYNPADLQGSVPWDNLSTLGGTTVGSNSNIAGSAGAKTIANSGNTNDYIDDYMNPYTGQVIDRTMGDLTKQNQILQQQNKAGAAAAGAFGGSRHGLVEAQTNADTMSQMADTSAGLRHQGFTTAADLAAGHVGQNMSRGSALAELTGQDWANNLQQDQQNWQNRFTVADTQGNMRAQDISNTGAAVAANNAAKQVKGNAYADMSDTLYGRGNDIADRQAAAGDKAQNAQQSVYDLAAQIFEGNDPQNIMANLQAVLTGSPLVGNTSTTQTSTSKPSTAATLGSIGKSVAALGGAK